jgi:hypothetical protein
VFPPECFIGVDNIVTKVVKITRYAKKSYNIYCGHPNKAWLHIIAEYGKAGKWGNPFEMEYTENINERMIVIWKFLIDYLLEDKERLQRVTELKDKILGCSCVPLPCHAQTLAYLADNPDTLRAAISGTKTKTEVAKEIFAFYDWTLPL